MTIAATSHVTLLHTVITLKVSNNYYRVPRPNSTFRFDELISDARACMCLNNADGILENGRRQRDIWFNHAPL